MKSNATVIIVLLKKVVGICVLLSFFNGGLANADPKARYEYGTVLDSRPIVEVFRHKEPQERCWDEKVVHRRDHRKSATSTILGGIIGAAIGNKVGHGRDNKRIGAVAGAVLGASIGNDVGRNHRKSRHYVSVEQRCSTVYEEIEEERVIGYKVKYRYAGQTYTTQTTRAPGHSIRLRVSVEAVE